MNECETIASGVLGLVCAPHGLLTASQNNAAMKSPNNLLQIAGILPILVPDHHSVYVP